MKGLIILVFACFTIIILVLSNHKGNKHSNESNTDKKSNDILYTRLEYPNYDILYDKIKCCDKDSYINGYGWINDTLHAKYRLVIYYLKSEAKYYYKIEYNSVTWPSRYLKEIISYIEEDANNVLINIKNKHHIIDDIIKDENGKHFANIENNSVNI